MKEITRQELEFARSRIRQWAPLDRYAVARLTEKEARSIALLTALLDIRPHHEEETETEEEASPGEMRPMSSASQAR